MSGMRGVFVILTTLLIAMVSQGVLAQDNVQPRANSEVEGTLGIEPGGDPKFKIYEMISVGCNVNDIRFAGKIVNFPTDAYVQTIVVAGGSTYMNQSFAWGNEVAAEINSWTLFNNNSGGVVDGVWPIPSNTPIDVTFNVTDGDGGAVLYTRELTISQCNGGEITSNQVVGEVSQPTRATFIVVKVFEDNNPSEVDVAIDCNTGQILDQDKSITPGVPIEFVVTSFTNETLNCEITESSVNGYSATYQNAIDNFSDVSCSFELVEDGEQGVCVIINTPDPVEIKVSKSWVIEGNNNDVNLNYTVYGYCDDEYIGYQIGEGLLDDNFTFSYIPAYPSSSCVIYEDIYDSGIEVDMGNCGSLTISAGKGASCAITNTVFFEGIPTLSQYGMAIMALLMLGMGFVGFRRFS